MNAAAPINAVSSWTGTRRGRWLTLALYALVLGLLAVPIFSVVVPPLGDYANHLARMHVMAAYADSPALQANYTVAWKLAPYLGMDLIVPQLARFLPIYTAGRVFLCLCLWLFVLGTAAVHAALFRRLSPWPAASGLFAYNYVFSWGFANYLFGIGIWLLAFAAWVVLSRCPARFRIAGGSVLSLAVFFSHFFAFFGYGLCVAAYELGVWLAARDRDAATLLRRAAVAFCPFIVPLVLFVADLGGQQDGGTEYGGFSDKLTALLSPVMFPGARFDLIILGFAIAVLAGGWKLGRLHLNPLMRIPLTLLAAAAVAMPNLLMDVWAMDFRLPVVLVFLLIAGCEWPRVPARLAIPLAVILLALLAANLLSIVWAWQPVGTQYDEFRAALQVLPPGVRVIAFRDDEGIDPSLRRGPFLLYQHLPALAVIERDAYLPYLFKYPLMPVGAARKLRAIDTPHGHTIELSELIEAVDAVKGPAMLGTPSDMGSRNFWGDWPRHYDYAIELSFGARPALPAQLELVKSGLIFNIYQIRPR